MKLVTILFGQQKNDVSPDDAPPPTPRLDQAIKDMGAKAPCPELADHAGLHPEARPFFSKYSMAGRRLGRGYPHDYPA